MEKAACGRKNLLSYNVIVACSHNNGLGFKGTIPWKIPQDLKHFKAVTSYVKEDIKEKKNLVVMGRKTWDGISVKFRPLSARINIVFTTDQSFKLNNPNQEESLYVVSNFDEYETEIKKLSGIVNEIYVIGGKKILDAFEQQYPNECRCVFYTAISRVYECDVHYKLPDGFQSVFVSQTFTQDEERTSYDYRLYVNSNQLKDFDYSNFSSYFTEYSYSEEILYLNKAKIYMLGNNINKGASFEFDCSKTFPLMTTKFQDFYTILDESIELAKNMYDQILTQDWSDINEISLSKNETNTKRNLVYKIKKNNGSLSLDVYFSNSEIGNGTEYDIAQSALILYIISHLLLLKREGIHLNYDESKFNDEVKVEYGKRLKLDPHPFPIIQINNSVGDPDLNKDNFELLNYLYHS